MHPELQAWLSLNEPEDKMLWKEPFWNQVMFVRDALIRALYNNGAEAEQNPVKVISTHTSKSIKLPVYQLTHGGMTITIRNNFYNWGVTVEANEELRYLSKPVFQLDTADSCFEGFPDNLRLKPYIETNRRSFSFAVGTDYQLWTAVYQLKQAYTEASNLSKSL